MAIDAVWKKSDEPVPQQAVHVFQPQNPSLGDEYCRVAAIVQDCETLSLGRGLIQQAHLNMFPAFPFSRKCAREKESAPHYGVLILGTLLLLFGFTARFTRYGVTHRDLQLTTAQSYLDEDPTGSQTVIAALLLLLSFAIAPIPVFAATISSGPRFATAGPARTKSNRELRVRPPPCE